MRITDVTLVCLQRSGRAVGREEAGLWRGLLQDIGADNVENLPAPGVYTPVYCKSASDCGTEILAGLHARSGLPLRIFGLDNALLREDYRAFQAHLRESGLPLEPAFGNDFGCATALGLTWLSEGGETLVCSFAGIGNLAPLEEILAALHLSGVKKYPGLSLLPRARDLFTRLGGAECVSADGTKAVIGTLLFTVESGVHVDGLLKDPSLYEPFAPELVGARRRIVLGAHSGRGSVRLRCSLSGLPCAEGQDAELAEAVRALGRERGRCLREDEFLALYDRVCRRSYAAAVGG
ncbi:MAG: hypothetical protein LBQ51_09160 [Desulfovibrio sp.]|jgi:homocitrate synthase NifV|nr:hypothetical protein [Desulfovibrio sp.]